MSASRAQDMQKRQIGVELPGEDLGILGCSP